MLFRSLGGLNVAKAGKEANQPGLLGGKLIGTAQVLGIAATALAIMTTEGLDAILGRTHHLLQDTVSILLLVLGEANLDPFTGQGPFDEDSFALMATDADAVMVQTV